MNSASFLNLFNQPSLSPSSSTSTSPSSSILSDKKTSLTTMESNSMYSFNDKIFSSSSSLASVTSLASTNSIHKKDNIKYVVDNSIDISHKNITAQDLVKLKEYFKDLLRSNAINHIEILRLGYNSFKDEGVIFVAETLSLKSELSDHAAGSIKSLDLSFNDITDIGAESIANFLSLSKLKVLFLSGNSISSKGFISIAEALRINESLTELDLTGNAGRNKGIIALAEALDTNRCLKSITLSGCKFQIQGIQRLCRTLEVNHNITSINVSNNNIGDDGAKEIARAMQRHRLIESLNISFNNITYAGMHYLGSSFVNYKSLKTLGLDNNKLRDKGSIYFSKIYMTMDLKDLNIGFNEIGVDGIVPLLQIIAAHMTLNVLSLSGNNIDYNAAGILSSLLSSNKTLHTLHLYHTGLSEASQRKIAVGIASNNEGVFTTLSGFDLAQSAHILGPLKISGHRSNKVILKCFNEAWKAKTMSQQSFQQELNGSDSILNGHVQISADSNKLFNRPVSTADLLSCVDDLAEEFLQDDDVIELFTNLKTSRKEKTEQVQEAVQELLLSCNDSIENALQMISEESVQAITKYVGSADELSPVDSNLLFTSILEAAKESLTNPFNAKELWELQQYYMSPKLDVLKDYQDEILDADELQTSDKNDTKFRRLSIECELPNAGNTYGDDVVLANNQTSKLADELTTRARKRSQGPIKIRIAFYPKIKELYESQKLEGNEVAMLQILRFMKFLETLPPPYTCRSDSTLEALFFEAQEHLTLI